MRTSLYLCLGQACFALVLRVMHADVLVTCLQALDTFNAGNRQKTLVEIHQDKLAAVKKVRCWSAFAASQHEHIDIADVSCEAHSRLARVWCLAVECAVRMSYRCSNFVVGGTIRMCAGCGSSG